MRNCRGRRKLFNSRMLRFPRDARRRRGLALEQRRHAGGEVRAGGVRGDADGGFAGFAAAVAADGAAVEGHANLAIESGAARGEQKHRGEEHDDEGYAEQDWEFTFSGCHGAGVRNRRAGGARRRVRRSKPNWLCFARPRWVRLAPGDWLRFCDRPWRALPVVGFASQRRGPSPWLGWFGNGRLGSSGTSRVCARKEVAHLAKFLVALLNGFVW